MGRDSSEAKYDVFVSHASEDKVDFVRLLVEALQDRGLRVWYDTLEIQLGDDFRLKMEDGLRESRFGVVVVSPSFHRYWPEAELSALSNQERIYDEKRILPVVHQMTPQEVTKNWPLLAARAAAYSSEGADAVADKIDAAVRQQQPSRTHGLSRLYGVPCFRSVHFVGREEELDQLQEILSRTGSVRVAASVEGLAGIGKTELALQLVHQLAHGAAFPGGIYWFDAEHPDLESTWGATVADEMGIPAGPVSERAAQAVRTVSRRDVPALIVLDNVGEWAAERRPQPLPQGSHLRYLVTTRKRRLGGTQFKHVEVGFPPHRGSTHFGNPKAKIASSESVHSQQGWPAPCATCPRTASWRSPAAPFAAGSSCALPATSTRSSSASWGVPPGVIASSSATSPISRTTAVRHEARIYRVG